ncbi:DUF7410 domain-containing protein [Halobaculum gomorrense]|uniref:C2H2-type domain-containing protein n=1 Tax=Halobaculum gomorrense TaxID=43928 RepID=A0A1M5N0Z1_9EURY|nr:hypothetical protein [Halobaculum gomorrense]SHG83240.1 hypothetical protein SAMN05443636_1223 [Halobaculum gomorrense]
MSRDDASADAASRAVDATSRAADATASETGDSGAAASAPATGARGRPAAPYDVPPGATAFTCSRCGRPFARERHRDLHLGQVHAELDGDERAAYEAARDEEADDLRRFRIVSLGMLVALYFGFLFLYAVAG